MQFEPGARAFQAAPAPRSRSACGKRGRSPARSSCSRASAGCSTRVRNPLWFETISHKGLRLALPVFHATLFAANLALAEGLLYRRGACGAGVFYAAALAGHAFVMRGGGRSSSPFPMPCASCSGRRSRDSPVSSPTVRGDLGTDAGVRAAEHIGRPEVRWSLVRSAWFLVRPSPRSLVHSYRAALLLGGIRTMNASRRLVPALAVQMKYSPVTSMLPFGSFE